MEELIRAIFLRKFEDTKQLLAEINPNVNNNNVNCQTHRLGNPPRELDLPTLVHIAVATNNPKILQLMITEYNANIAQLDHDSQDKFLSILINQDFNNSTPQTREIITNSILKNIDILYRNGGIIHNAAVTQLILNYNNMLHCRQNLRKIIIKLFVLKATNQFLHHLHNNNIQMAKRFKNTDVRNLYREEYPRLTELAQGIPHIYIDTNYNAGIHGLPILIAAENNGYAMLEVLSERPKYGQSKTNFSLKNSDGTSVFHILARTNNINGFELVCEKLTPEEIRDLLISKTNGVNGQTPLAIARQNGNQEAINFLENYATQINNSVFDEVKLTNPNKLRALKEAGCVFTNTHPITEGNVLHYAILGKKHANLRFVWNELSLQQKTQFLLGNMQVQSFPDIVFQTPLQLTDNPEYENSKRLLNILATSLVGSTTPETIRELKDAGYNLTYNFEGKNALHYAVLEGKINNIIALFEQTSLDKIGSLLNAKTMDTKETALQIAIRRNLHDIIDFLEKYKKIETDFNQSEVLEDFSNFLDMFENNNNNAPSTKNNAVIPTQQAPLLFTNALAQSNQSNNNNNNNSEEPEKENQSENSQGSQNSKKRKECENDLEENASNGSSSRCTKNRQCFNNDNDDDDDDDDSMSQNNRKRKKK